MEEMDIVKPGILRPPTVLEQILEAQPEKLPDKSNIVHHFEFELETLRTDIYQKDDGKTYTALPKTRVKRSDEPERTLNITAKNDEVPEYDIFKEFTNDATGDAEGMAILKNMSIFDNKGRNVVKERAEKYMIENILYCTDPAILALFDIKKPDLAGSRLDLLDTDDRKSFYKELSVPFIAYVLAEKNPTDPIVSRISVSKCLEKLKSVMLEHKGKKDMFSIHARFLFEYAFYECRPWMGTFLRNPDRWSRLFYLYTRSDAFYKTWDSLYIKENARTREDYFAEIQNVKAILNVLEPLGKYANDAVFYMNVHTMFYYMGPSLKKNDVIDKALKESVAVLMKRIKEKGSQSHQNVITSLSFSAGMGGATTEFHKALVEIQYQLLDGVDFTKGPAAFLDDLGNKFYAKLKVKCPSLVYNLAFKNVCLAIFRGCQALLIGYTIYNRKSLDTFSKAYFTLDSIGVVLDVATSINAGNEGFTEIGTYIGKLLRTIPNAELQTAFDYIFVADAASFILTRFTPVLLGISFIKSLTDTVDDLKEGGWGKAVFDGVTAFISLGAALLLFAGVAWSGPLALLTGVTVVVIQGAKSLIFDDPSETKQFFDKYLPADLKRTSPTDKVYVPTILINGYNK
ncbi:hypothetical protein DFA_03824 [Cavenderia fasciculata]|uniref:Uncharacterized protein n=1 Tax=Cavenderia fasciculata TaxID=261658 RepID=F4Q0H9_CACFS|nr:uncharacterized protein DFA_03824 [Cavenderia fasciculata]EGG18330.1 hypothetical protein DFA_03824 [Cavenderia fasciculata]|eukprot:XP_004366234.1 hypothetical protein DFA_03824 [Cavenderia fasciculata]